MVKNNVYIGEKIAEIMTLKKVTKAEMARRLGVRPQSVDYMLSRKSIDTDTLYCVSKALDYDFAQLFSIESKYTDYTQVPEKKTEIKNAKIIIEFELDKEEILSLDLNDKISKIIKKRL